MIACPEHASSGWSARNGSYRVLAMAIRVQNPMTAVGNQPTTAGLTPNNWPPFSTIPVIKKNTTPSSTPMTVRAPAPVVRKGPQIVNLNRRQTSFPRPANDAKIQRPAEKLRENRDNVYLQNPNLVTAEIAEKKARRGIFLLVLVRALGVLGG